MKNEASVKETALQATDHSAGTTTSDEDKKKKKQKEARPMASLSETLAFVFQCGPRVQFLFVLGSIGGFFNGLVYPALAYLFSGSFSDISGASNSGLSQVRDLAYNFMIIGTFALVNGLIQTWCFEIVAYYASQNFRLSWFRALLRQDPAYFDVNDIGGLAAQVGPNSNKFRRGVGRKFGEGIQFATTGVGGLAFAFYVSWRVAFVVLSVIPLISIAAISVVNLNQTKGSRAAKSYRRAGGVAYSTVSAIKTVLSLNAVSEMIRQYTDATQEAFNNAVSILVKQGFANGEYSFYTI
jgi:ATP-binding cassette subfamily B (MDR/TAP) protein 1